MSLKEQKELFVTGLHGTTPLELLLICSTAVSGILLFQATAKVSSSPYGCPRWLWEAVAFWLPTILCQTVWLYPYGVAYMVVQILVAVLLVSFPTTHHRLKSQEPPAVLDSAKDTSTAVSNLANDDSQRLAVTVYRSGLMLLTMTAILAVDFHVFPRSLGKTETSGYSLMDLGAASFVIAAGMVSPRARNSSSTSAIQSSKSTPSTPLLSKQMRRMLPLLFMGLLRLWTHQELEYQEHASEYGVHWNFFFTLALLSPLATVLSNGRSVPSGTRPVLILVVYQLLLQTGLQEWVQEAPRSCATWSSLCDTIVRILVRQSRGPARLRQLRVLVSD
jgi:glucosaminylphosphatidylinositol acyltransferase